jgi:methionyl-tRNA synthetase
VSSGEKQTTYVWFDALPNYWTATRYPESRAEWPAQLHVIGKDITRFHAVIWPAMLEAAGLPLPERVWAHGFVQFRGERFSKSAGARLDLKEAVDRFGADAFRYFLLREVPWDSDGNFSWERFEERYNAELADGLGNLAARSLTMLSKYRDGVVPDGGATDLDQQGLDAIDSYVAAMDRLDLRGGADAAWELVTAANLFVQQRAPWSLAKTGRNTELDDVLGSLARCLYRLAILASPFLPRTAERLFEAVGGQGSASAAAWDSLANPGLSGARTSVPPILFPKPETVS